MAVLGSSSKQFRALDQAQTIRLSIGIERWSLPVRVPSASHNSRVVSNRWVALQASRHFHGTNYRFMNMKHLHLPIYCSYGPVDSVCSIRSPQDSLPFTTFLRRWRSQFIKLKIYHSWLRANGEAFNWSNVKTKFLIQLNSLSCSRA